jgi:hypothetical protein
MSTAVTINDIIPRTQAIATNGQTVFNTNWTADVAANVNVYARADGVAADDATQLVSSSLYNVTFIGDSETARVTFLSGRTANDIITIVRNTPADRQNLYTNTNFTPSMLNDDFGILDLVDQQAQLFDEELAPHYNKSCTFTDESDKTIDNILPILEANQIWAKNNANNEIIAYDVPASGGLAPKTATYLVQTATSELPNAQAMGSLPTGIVVNTTTTGVQLTRILTGTANQIDLTNGSGLSGNPTVSITDNPILPGTGSFIPPKGTTAQRPVSPVAGMVRYNTNFNSLEVYQTSWDLLSGGLVDTITGTANQITIDNTDPANPIIAIASNVILPGTAGETLPSGTTAQRAGGAGTMRFNSQTLEFEGTTDGIAWNSFQTSAGTILSVSGTANRITVTAGVNPVVDIAATYVGQTSITTLGTIATGSWNGTVIGSTYGGTGVNNGASTITLGGSLTTVGAFASTFTMTGVTGVTFPTSGTLATTSQIPTGASLTKTDDTNVTLTLGGSPTTALVNAASLTLGWTGILSKARGGTSVASATIAPTSLEFSAWDTNLNLSANAFIEGFATTATAAGTTTLTVASKQVQEFTGATTQTIVMPVTSTLVAGMKWMIINNSSGNLTINSSGGNLILTMAANTTAWITCVLNSGTTAASWNSSYLYDLGAGVVSITGTANQVIASASTGAITLSLPQSIATTSDVTFGSVAFSPNTKGIVGTPTNDSAGTGYVGEYVSSNIPVASAVSISTATSTNLTSISLTAGDWLVGGNVRITNTGQNLTRTFVWVSTTSATLPDNSNTNEFDGNLTTFLTGGGVTPAIRVSVSGTTTVYASGRCVFGAGTSSMSGNIWARRLR